MEETTKLPAMGWIPDLPDIRDFSPDTAEIDLKLADLGRKESINSMLMRLKTEKPRKAPIPLPASKDLRPWFSPVENQLTLGSCTANAGVGLVEYFERRAYGKHIDASRIFLYKVTRDLLKWTGDRGAYLRTTMKALTLFGVPPEEYCPYVVADFDIEPSAFLYAFAQNYQAITYYRLDPPGSVDKNALLLRIKTHLSMNLPSMFGFTVYTSINQANQTGKIPFPFTGDRVAGGHAIVAAGYDDNVRIKHSGTGAPEYKGALLIRNSWGTGWGDNGYGWLPYEYVLKGLATDWWSLLKSEWIDTGNFN
ncbi:MAG: C1 family peptidase [Bacteroidales bacterium]